MLIATQKAPCAWHFPGTEQMTDFHSVFCISSTISGREQENPNQVGSLHRQYEFRCPIHGFITLNSWEKEIISQPAFQRLRRIRQLAWTDQVYPGAMHTRFEHSLGVMHTATRLYSAIRQACSDVLQEELGYKEEGLNRDLQLVRLAALLHDVGHAPFSHASEILFPEQANGKKYKHESYSAAIVRTELRSAIEDHPLNETNYGFKAEDVAALLEGSTSAKQRLFWRDLIDGQMDADRMDYLLRDSFHAGVQYGKFDLNRLVNTVRAIPGTLGRGPRFGISEGGCHAAEGLVLARYFMFTQVYFHKTRVAFDIHLKGALQELLPSHQFPNPTGEHLKEFLLWDDWRVLGLLASGQGGEHGSRLANRNHYRLAYHSPEISTEADFCVLENVKAALRSLIAAEEESSKSWYKTGPPDIPVVSDVDSQTVLPLSRYSNVVLNMKPTNQMFLYVRPEDAEKANEIVKGVLENERTRQGSFGFNGSSS
jgi:HD superfamily phosphohydrolase